jgi:Fe-S cluster assembly iron-binding protein IscA
MTRLHGSVIALLTGAACLNFVAGCGGGPKPSAPPAQPATSPADEDVLTAEPLLTPEPWAGKPPAAWPQIVLTNKASFRGHSGLGGASAFLVKAPDGRVLAATARHLLGSDGGVHPEVAVETLERDLVSWQMHPRTQAARFVAIDRPFAANYDMVLLELKPQQGELPAHPLQVRTGPLRVGEKVSLVGCPYSEAGCRQNVYAGRVTKRLDGPEFLFDVSPPVVLRGFSGAPVVDEHGYAVGVLGGMTGDRTPDGRDRVGRAEELRVVFLAEDVSTGVTLTASAAEQVRRLMAGKPGMVLRLSYKGDSPGLDLDPVTDANDWRTESRGIPVVIERKDVARLRGAVVDYLPGGGFSISSPRPFRRR